jgi:hypothetical protein
VLLRRASGLAVPVIKTAILSKLEVLRMSPAEWSFAFYGLVGLLLLGLMVAGHRP